MPAAPLPDAFLGLDFAGAEGKLEAAADAVVKFLDVVDSNALLLWALGMAGITHEQFETVHHFIDNADALLHKLPQL